MPSVYASTQPRFEEMTFGYGVRGLCDEAFATEAPYAEQVPAVVEEEQPAGLEAAEDPAVERLSARLANGLARLIVTALREFEEAKAGESHALIASVQRQEERLAVVLQTLAESTSRVDGLAEMVSEQTGFRLSMQENYERLAGNVESLREADSRHESAVDALRRETQNVWDSWTDRLDALMHRVGLQQEETSALQATTSEVSAKVVTVVERLERQAEMIRGLCARQVQREAALEELGGALTRLKASYSQTAEEVQL